MSFQSGKDMFCRKFMFVFIDFTSYQIMFISFDRNATGFASGSWTVCHSNAPESTPWFIVGSCSIFSILCNVLWTIYCHFLLTIILYVLPFLTSEDFFALIFSTCSWSMKKKKTNKQTNEQTKKTNNNQKIWKKRYKQTKLIRSL